MDENEIDASLQKAVENGEMEITGKDSFGNTLYRLTDKGRAVSEETMAEMRGNAFFQIINWGTVLYALDLVSRRHDIDGDIQKSAKDEASKLRMVLGETLN